MASMLLLIAKILIFPLQILHDILRSLRQYPKYTRWYWHEALTSSLSLIAIRTKHLPLGHSPQVHYYGYSKTMPRLEDITFLDSPLSSAYRQILTICTCLQISLFDFNTNILTLAIIQDSTQLQTTRPDVVKDYCCLTTTYSQKIHNIGLHNSCSSKNTSIILKSVFAKDWIT